MQIAVICFSIIFHSYKEWRISAQIDYYTGQWAIPTAVYDAIVVHEKICENTTADYYNGTIEKLVVSAFIGHFKFSGTDVRTDGINKPNSFQSDFPQPPLQYFDLATSEICKVNSEACIHYIYTQLHTESVEKTDNGLKTYPGRHHHIISIQHKNKNITPLQLFRFKATAMISICYWSILVDDPINNMDWSCTRPGRKFIRTMRTPCMINAVCPNPCCGTHKVNNTNKDCNFPMNEQCSLLVKTSSTNCTRKEGHQVYRGISMTEFAKNGPLFDCQCPPGQKWFSDYLACLDEDECVTDSHRCDKQSQYCVNQPNGYFCVCQWGFEPKSRYICSPRKLNRLSRNNSI